MDTGVTVVLAALDDSPAAQPTLAAAGLLAKVLGAELRAIHVVTGAGRTVAALCERRGVELRQLEGPASELLVAALSDPEAVALVLGSRGHPAGRRPAGRTALEVIQRVEKPVLLVPPEASAERWERVLVPLDSTAAASRGVDEVVRRLADAGLQVLGLHVFDAKTAPRYWDASQHGAQVWSTAFLARHLPHLGAQLHLRTGAAGQEITQFSAEHDVDVVVLGWSRDLTEGRAATVRDVLSRSRVPVLLLPVASAEG
ncbi:MAG TPA: universal stress protein [Acidimicrobiales bacterium]|nr:universal stress protein [Acidimicrobiales bacterium]